MSMRPKTVSPSKFALLALTTLAATFDARGEDDFKDIIGRTAKESRPAPPQVVRPKSGSPNVFYILDHVGFAELRRALLRSLRFRQVRRPCTRL
jgi:hypothetical protein